MYGILNTPPEVRPSSSRISTRLRQRLIDCVYQALARRSLSVDYFFLSL
ncbi:MAG: hypothetical protein ACK55Z_12585 [bacterium]